MTTTMPNTGPVPDGTYVLAFFPDGGGWRIASVKQSRGGGARWVTKGDRQRIFGGCDATVGWYPDPTAEGG